jgi:hypothetical protein
VGIFNTSVMAVVAIGAAGVMAAASVPAMAATTSGVRYRQTYTGVNWGEPAATGGLGLCSLGLLSAADSAGRPAYVSGLLENSTPSACTGWLQHSVNGGAWTDVSPRQTLPATKHGWVNYPWAKTDDYYAGPGTRVRACVLTPASPNFPSEAKCSTSTVTLPASDAAAQASDRTPALFAHNNQSATINGSGRGCGVFLNSTGAVSKTATSKASMTVEGTTTCTAWLETSADKGTTWKQATPTYSLPFTNPLTDWAFSPVVADGTGELARACGQFGTHAKVCTPAW